MATSSEVKSGFDQIAILLASQRQRLADAIKTAEEVGVTLNAIPTTFADLIATVNAYTPTGAFETLAKDELAKMTAEFQALVTDADIIAAVDLDD